MTRAMKVLVDVKQIVAVDFPGGGLDSRLKRYRIADPYLRFWFRFVEPQLRNIEVGRPDLAVEAFRRSWPTSGPGDRAHRARSSTPARPEPGGAALGHRVGERLVGTDRHARIRPDRRRA